MVINQGANYMGGAVNLLKRQTAQFEKEDQAGLADAVRPAGLGLGGRRGGKKKARRAAQILHGYGPNEHEINLPWARERQRPTAGKGEGTFDGRSVITNDEGEKEDPMAVLKRFNALRDKIQASPLLRRIDKITPGSTAEVRKALLAHNDLAGTRLPPIFAPISPKPPRPKTPPFDRACFVVADNLSRPPSRDLKPALKKAGDTRHRHHHQHRHVDSRKEHDRDHVLGEERTQVGRAAAAAVAGDWGRDEFAFEPGASGAIESAEEPARQPAGLGESNGSGPFSPTCLAGEHSSQAALDRDSAKSSGPALVAPGWARVWLYEEDDPFATAPGPPEPERTPAPPALEPAGYAEEVGQEEPLFKETFETYALQPALEEEDLLGEPEPEHEPELSTSRTLPPSKRRRPVHSRARLASAFGRENGLDLLAAVPEVEQEVFKVAVGSHEEQQVHIGQAEVAEQSLRVVTEQVETELSGGERGDVWPDAQPEVVPEDDENNSVVALSEPCPELLDIPDVTLTRIANDNPTSELADFYWKSNSYGTDPPVDEASQVRDDATTDTQASENEDPRIDATLPVWRGRPMFQPLISSHESDPFDDAYERRLHEQGQAQIRAGVGPGSALFSEARFFGAEQ